MVAALADAMKTLCWCPLSALAGTARLGSAGAAAGVGGVAAPGEVCDQPGTLPAASGTVSRATGLGTISATGAADADGCVVPVAAGRPAAATAAGGLLCCVLRIGEGLRGPARSGNAVGALCRTFMEP